MFLCSIAEEAIMFDSRWQRLLSFFFWKAIKVRRNHETSSNTIIPGAISDIAIIASLIYITTPANVSFETSYWSKEPSLIFHHYNAFLCSYTFIYILLTSFYSARWAYWAVYWTSRHTTHDLKSHGASSKQRNSNLSYLRDLIQTLYVLGNTLKS